MVRGLPCSTLSRLGESIRWRIDFKVNSGWTRHLVLVPIARWFTHFESVCTKSLRQLIHLRIRSNVKGQVIQDTIVLTVTRHRPIHGIQNELVVPEGVRCEECDPIILSHQLEANDFFPEVAFLLIEFARHIETGVT